MKKWLIATILIFCMIPLVQASDVGVSTDNATWNNATTACKTDSCTIVGLDSGILYYIRSRENASYNWSYTQQRTEESVDGMLVGLMIILIGAGFMTFKIGQHLHENPFETDKYRAAPIFLWMYSLFTLFMSSNIALEYVGYGVGTSLQGMVRTTVWSTLALIVIMFIYFISMYFMDMWKSNIEQKQADLEDGGKYG